MFTWTGNGDWLRLIEVIAVIAAVIAALRLLGEIVNLLTAIRDILLRATGQKD